jgi:hypothetical protein
VRVKGRYPDGSVFDEMATCEDASTKNVSIHLRHPVRQKQLLYLSLPLPSRLRQYDLTDHSYKMYALVRNVIRSDKKKARVSLHFYGRLPPQGHEALSPDLFLMPDDAGATGLPRRTTASR